MRTILLILIVILMNFKSSVSVADNGSGAQNNPNDLLENQEIILGKMLAYTGFDSSLVCVDAKGVTPELLKVSNDNTPFIAAMVNNREVWHLKFRNVPVERGSVKTMRDFEVKVDPQTGNLLSIYSISETAGSSDTLPEPTAEDSEKFLNDRAYTFDGLPSEIPKVSFNKALEACIMNPVRAKIIRGIYVNHSTITGKLPPAWIIILRGLDASVPVSGRAEATAPFNQRNSILCAVDATTGYLIYCTNAPYRRNYKGDSEK